LAAVDIGKYAEGYLQEWDQRATVRARQRYRLTADAVSKELYPAVLMPLLKHPEIVALGEEARRRIAAQTACAGQEAIAGIEADVVAELCSRLASDGAGVPLPGAARQVALTIGTDELYHAYVAREFAADIERLSGVPALAGDEARPPLYAAVAFIRKAASGGLRRSAETMALCIAEHFVTEELFGVSKETVSDSPFHFTLREHLADEGRHQVFFRHLMRHLWEASDEEARTALGRLIPGFLDAFLNPGFQGHLDRRILEGLGFTGDDSTRIATEAATLAYGPPSDGDKSLLPAARHPLRLLKEAGILDHGPTRERLIGEGWLVDQGKRPVRRGID
jgi:hypothetical protein